MKRTDPPIPRNDDASPPPSPPPRESNCSPVNNERCCFIELSLPYWCHFMAPASVPHPARTFSPPFSRTIARIIPGKLVERSFWLVCAYFIFLYISLSLSFFSFSFSLCDRLRIVFERKSLGIVGEVEES